MSPPGCGVHVDETNGLADVVPVIELLGRDATWPCGLSLRPTSVAGLKIGCGNAARLWWQSEMRLAGLARGVSSEPA